MAVSLKGIAFLEIETDGSAFYSAANQCLVGFPLHIIGASPMRQKIASCHLISQSLFSLY